MYAASEASKFADPLMTSGSYLAPSAAALPLGLTFAQSQDRNTYAYGIPPGSSASPNADFSGLFSSGFYQLPSVSPNAFSRPAASGQPQAQAGLYGAADLLAPAASAPTNLAESAPVVTYSDSMQPQVVKTAPLDTTSGHYTSFYSGTQLGDTPDQPQSHLQQGVAYLAGAQQPVASPEQVAAAFGAHSELAGQEQQQQQQANEQFVSSASSQEAPSYLEQPAQQVPKIYFATQTQAQPRRSGPVVSIKLDEQTRSRLQEQLGAMQRQQQQLAWSMPSGARQSAPNAQLQQQQQQALARQQQRQQLAPAADSSADHAKWTPTSSGAADSPMQAPAQQLRAQQGQPQAYLIIRPRTASAANSFAPQWRQQTGDNLYHYYETSGAPVVRSSEQGWRSVAGQQQRQQQAAGQAIAAQTGNEDNQPRLELQQQQQQQEQTSGANESSSPIGEQPRQLLRVSRTPPAPQVVTAYIAKTKQRSLASKGHKLASAAVEGRQQLSRQQPESGGAGSAPAAPTSLADGTMMNLIQMNTKAAGQRALQDSGASRSGSNENDNNNNNDDDEDGQNELATSAHKNKQFAPATFDSLASDNSSSASAAAAASAELAPATGTAAASPRRRQQQQQEQINSQQNNEDVQLQAANGRQLAPADEEPKQLAARRQADKSQQHLFEEEEQRPQQAYKTAAPNGQPQQDAGDEQRQQRPTVAPTE